ncbi:S-adenosylmethionine:tRNA ribosyltransferase-isomerase [Catenulispora sp. NL8]|uniref:S-adenosylmethionine:tRNA ribosyltransferase-isomerase n=1 Tax=Catenulispora pinistramenti TaxID=2705254 RepID=A0ABS5KT56_9ACTN|nr:S-adenosylmethionine:tRNA ribosyltransferase-isomerase [Catenulispora pinistramenti]MBS2549241.1 S-adenosylmethionine:tRNA ribosyltransferase-isomerase [Catenulispora pinistramenti]
MTILLHEPTVVCAASCESTSESTSTPSAGPAFGPLDPGFSICPDLLAHKPAEARGLERDGVRLLVARGRGADDPEVGHYVFTDLPDVLEPGDLLVVNNSGTLPAALDAVDLDTGAPLVLHVSTGTPQDPDAWIIELRRPMGDGSTKPFALEPDSPDPDSPAAPGLRLRVTGGATVTLLRPYTRRLWVARLDLGASVADYLTRHGRAIRYDYVDRDWPLAAYQTVFAAVPGSAEMPSAARPFSADVVARLVAKGVYIAPITLHTGVASPEAHEKPYAEWYSVPAATAELVNHVRSRGGRVIAIGTTAVRALESVADEEGTVHPGQGWTELIITPERGVRAVDGLLTGFHEPQASHLLMLTAIAGPRLIRASYDAALAARYLWHEFGDVNLLLRK